MRCAAIVVAIVAGCSSGNGDGQSFHDGVQALCDLPDHMPDGASAQQRLAGAIAWGEMHITNAEVLALGHGGKPNAAALGAAVKTAGIARCKLLDNGIEFQSFTDAIELMCDAPAAGSRDEQSRYLRTHIVNGEVALLFANVVTHDPAAGDQVIAAALAKAGVTHCAFTEARAHATTVPLDLGSAARSAPPDAIVAIDGETISLFEGSGAKPNMVVTRDHLGELQTALADVAHRHPSAKSVEIRATPATPMPTVTGVLAAVRNSSAQLSNVSLSTPAGK